MRLLLAFVAAVLPAMACDCVQLSACAYVDSPTIFIGEVIDGGVTSIQDDPWYANVTHLRFKVLENFKGLPAGTETVDIASRGSGGMCAPNPFFPGRKYLVVPTVANGKLFVGGCSGSRDIESAEDDIQAIRDYFRTKQFIIHGRVAAAPSSDAVGVFLALGEAKPLAGVTISTRQNGKTISAVTDPDGRYSLPVASARTYSLQAALSPYRSEIVAALTAGACAEQNFGLTIDNAISGKVLDERGDPVPFARVGLIDLDHASSGDPWLRHDWFNDAYQGRPSAGFTFRNVPIGRYLLVFNPDGPQWGGDLPGQAFDTTYYPSGSSRANARVIEVKSSGVHLTNMNLVIGKPVESRRVTVRVRFPDGNAMKTAQIRCVGLPLEPRGSVWIERDSLPEDTAQFRAPANRKLRIEVRDSYGRDLGKAYTADFGPGTTAIDQEFVVTP